MTEKHVAGGADAVLDTPEDHHRHTSHLFAVYPGRQISVAKTPALAAAAKVSLAARGNVGDVREWSYAWRAALWARLHDGDKALEQVRQFFTDKNSCPNLFGLHPPMQIDGDFGLSGAMPEMLVQSHEGEIHLLPALPTAWAAGALALRASFETTPLHCSTMVTSAAKDARTAAQHNRMEASGRMGRIGKLLTKRPALLDAGRGWKFPAGRS